MGRIIRIAAFVLPFAAATAPIAAVLPGVAHTPGQAVISQPAGRDSLTQGEARPPEAPEPLLLQFKRDGFILGGEK
jgi:hypothetical protein